MSIYRKIADEIMSSAYTNEIQTHGWQAAHVSYDKAVDYAEGREDWRYFNNAKRTRILAWIKKMV